MAEPRAYLNGSFVAASEMLVPVHDTGFMWGVTVAEQLRTFGGQIFHWRQHEQRLGRSLRIMGVDPSESVSDLQHIAERLVGENHQLSDPRDDLGVTIFITPGAYPTYTPDQPRQPTVGVHTYPLPFSMWAEKYAQGQTAIISPFAQVPADCWPRELKCRSRMHYYLADRAAREIDPTSIALLLDGEGHLCEASTANVLVFFPDEGLVSPPRDQVLPGVSLGFVAQLARQTGVAFSHRTVRREEVSQATEVLLTSTPYCLLPVVQVDGKPVGSGRPGTVFQQLLAAWNAAVGVDIARQAHEFAVRKQIAAS